MSIIVLAFCAPALAQGIHEDSSVGLGTLTGAIDFGDDTGAFANDGECDDPRFGGTLASHRGADASDCLAAHQADATTPIDMPRNEGADIDFGDDSGYWAMDEECDDPRFGGRLTNHYMADATDCQQAYGSGASYEDMPRPEVEPAPTHRPTTARSRPTLTDPQDILAAITEGTPFQWSGPSYLFAGGLASYLLQACDVAIAADTRIEVSTFAYAAAQRGMMGNDYSNPDIGAMLANQTASTATFAAGAHAARQTQCRGASELLSHIADLVRSNRETDNEDGPSFIQTCTPVHGSASCQCLARLGSAVYPNIYQMQYDRSIIAGIIQSNPILALQMLGCGIGDY